MSKRYEIVATITDKRGRILSVGRNSYIKTHPMQACYAEHVGLNPKQFIHAEIDAIVRLKHGVPHKIKVERYSDSGKPRNAAPCPICAHAIKVAGIKFIEHTVG